MGRNRLHIPVIKSGDCQSNKQLITFISANDYRFYFHFASRIPFIYSFSLCSSLKIVPEKLPSNERNIKED
jgi:hypothetical protein